MVKEHRINNTEMAYLLKMVEVGTRRKFTSEEGSLWLNLLSDYTYDDCHEAFTEYLKNRGDEYLTPSLITSIIKKKRKARLNKGIDLEEPPNGLSGSEYLKWYNQRKREVIKAPRAPQPPQQALQQGSTHRSHQVTQNPRNRAIGN